MEKLYTAEEAAEYLGIGYVTLWRLRKRGKIAYRKSGSWLRFTASDIQAYVDSLKTQKEAPERRRKRR